MNTNNTMTYPQVQAIEPTAAYKKATRGIKTGRVLLVGGIAIAAGLSNILSINNIIGSNVFNVIISTGIIIAVFGFIITLVYTLKLKSQDNHNLVESVFSNKNSAFHETTDGSAWAGVRAPLQ